MSIMAEIKLLIQDCVSMPDGMGNPMIDQHDADRYINFLDRMLAAASCAQIKSWNKVYYAGRCPVCGFDQTEGKSVDIDGGTATQDCYCLKCDAKWYNTYTLRETTITWTTSPEQST